MLKVNNKDTRTTTYFTPGSSASIVNCEQVNAGWPATVLQQKISRLARQEI